MSNRTALVTGASRGIGRAICLELAKAGCNVVVNYAGSQEAAQLVVDECIALGVQAVAIQADVSCPEQAQHLVEQTIQLFGAIHILVNNAGITRDNLLMRMSEDDLDAVLNTNLKGAFHCMKAACRPMMKQRFGRIVNISSVVGVRGNAGQANYAASKAGLIGMSKSIAKELASRGITVNCVAPGFIETDMTLKLKEVNGGAAWDSMMARIPMGYAGKPSDVGNLVAFLASDEAAYITSEVINVGGGMIV